MSQQSITRGMSHSQPNSFALGSSDSGPPHVGLLSRTLIHSSVVKWILPARIRSPGLNDVVFIGCQKLNAGVVTQENFVEIHQLTSQGRLQQEGTKTDFRAEIRDAKVFGVQKDVLALSNGNGIFPSEEDQKPNTSLPQDMLVLTLDSGYMVFMYARTSQEQGQIDFIVSQRRIGPSGIEPQRLGRAVAVDPKSRALAVSAYQDSFRLFSLRSMEEIHEQIRNGQLVDPIKEEKTFAVNGVIAHLEFLYPSPSDPNHVVLLLFLIDSRQNSRLMLYEWTAGMPLATAERCGQHGLRLSEDISYPLHVIPLMIESAFVIVTENSTFVAKSSDILSGNATFRQVAMQSASGSLITAWVRPTRHPRYADEHDDIYLAMENGDIFFIEADKSDPRLVQTATKATHLDCTIDTAFAALDNGLDSHDILVVGGQMSSGGVYLLEIKPFPVSTEARLEESVTNWAPVIDFELLDTSSLGHSHSGAHRDRVFACTGSGYHGAITELRRGVQARIQSTAEYVSGIQRLFILPDSAGRGYFVLASFGDHSSLLFLDPTSEGWNECDDDLLHLEEPTLAAGGFETEVVRIKEEGEEMVSDRPSFSLWAIQITSSAITVQELNGDRYTKPEECLDGTEASSGRKLQRKCEGNQAIVAAAVAGSQVLLATREEGQVTLRLAEIRIEDGSDEFLVPIGAPIPLDEVPTFLNFSTLRDHSGTERTISLAGTRQAAVCLYLCDANGLSGVIEQSMLDATVKTQREIDLFYCESAVIIHTEGAARLLCGLRGGTVLVFKLIISPGTLSAKRDREIAFGPIPVHLYPDVRRKDSTFVLAGPEMYRFDLPKDRFRATQVVFKDSTLDPEIQAMVHVDNAPDPENIIICASKDQLFHADVGQSERLCGRRLRIQETPRRLLFYAALNLFVVGTQYRRHGASYCSLRFIDPHTCEQKGDSIVVDGRQNRGGPIFTIPGEQIYCLAPWDIFLDGKLYRFIAVGTGIIPSPPGSKSGPGGRLLILTVRLNEQGKVVVQLRFTIICEAPVYSLAQYGVDAFLYCSGSQLFMKTMKDVATTKRLSDVAKMNLRSPAVQMTVDVPLIHLSLSKDSLLILRFDEDQKELRESFSAQEARNSFHHFSVSPSITILTDKHSGIVGYSRPIASRTLESLDTIFDGILPSSITRIRRGNCRPPWSTPNSRLPGVITGDNALIASGMNGSFFQLTVLSASALRLLRLVRQIYGDDVKRRVRASGGSGWWGAGEEVALRPPSEVETVTYLDDIREEWNPEDAHVDGDLLVPIVALGDEWLRERVEGSGNQRMRTLFLEAAEAVFGDREAERESDEEGDVFTVVVRWVEGLLDDAVL